MRDKQREKYLAEIERYETAIARSTSKFLIRDYQKKLRKMKQELKYYDRCHKYGCRSDT